MPASKCSQVWHTERNHVNKYIYMLWAVWTFEFRIHKMVQRCCCCCWPGAGAGGTAGRGRPGMRIAPAPPAAASAARPAWLVASFCSRWKKTKIYIKSNYREIPYDHESVLRIRDVYLGSRILIFTHPGSRISDPGYKNSNKREGWKKFVVITFYVATNFTKLHIILVLMCWRKKFGPIFKEL
jgi:hypothetical protein